VIIDQLNELWNSLITFTEQFVIPDWTALVDLLPVFLLIGVVGPIITILALFWVRYVLVRPRVKAGWAEARRAAPLDAQGQPVFPAGEPYSLSEGLIYGPGATRSDSGESLLVACPKCGLVRTAEIDTCGNCGLSFRLTPATRVIRPAAPPPGGRAAV
jgi:hypothetical protein